jgi:hypothetical protein
MLINKRGLSSVVESILLILLTVVAIGVIAAFVVPLVQNNLKSAGSCLDVFDQVTLNEGYTCLNSESGLLDDTTANPEDYVLNDDVLVSIKVGKVDVDGFLVALSREGETKSFEIKKGDLNVIEGVSMYRKRNDPLATEEIEIPAKNEGKTYRIRGFSGAEHIQIAPIVKGEPCAATDSRSLNICRDK